ncbi:MAG TPA: Spy/CpxP family protein refolding chaperone [Methylomirabilota bacterium]|nr:Spy/CpxP family protein refolding chaperone [Methylomirabilota bacterium]
MRAMHVFRAAAVTMIATLVTATALYAAQPATGATTDRTSRWENHLQQKLGLTEDQLNAFRQLRANRDVNAEREHFKALRTAQGELRRMALNGADATTMAAKQAEVQNLVTQSMQRRLDALKQIGPILNDDQREAFAKMMDHPRSGHHRGQHQGETNQKPS